MNAQKSVSFYVIFNLGSGKFLWLSTFMYFNVEKSTVFKLCARKISNVKQPLKYNCKLIELNIKRQSKKPHFSLDIFSSHAIACNN